MKSAALVLLALLVGCGGCAGVPSRDYLKGTALRLEFTDGLCSGTSRGPHELSTAAHCVAGGALVKVNGKPVSVVGIRETGPDAVIVSVRGIKFDRWPRVGVAKQGDNVWWIGQPMGAPFQLRQGYVSGIWEGDVLIAAATCVGDSGSGIFNERGELVGIVSRIPTPRCSAFVLAVPA
jgi:V8-like Glu-specific endopeptidase